MSSIRSTRTTTRLMVGGLALAAWATIVLIAGIASGATPTAYVFIGLFVGLVIAAVGFGARILAAVEKR